MMIDIPVELIESLRTLLHVCEDVADQHSVCHHSEELIENWTPSEFGTEISCPAFTVGLMRDAKDLKRKLKL